MIIVTIKIIKRYGKNNIVNNNQWYFIENNISNQLKKTKLSNACKKKLAFQ